MFSDQQPARPTRTHGKRLMRAASTVAAAAAAFAPTSPFPLFARAAQPSDAATRRPGPGPGPGARVRLRAARGRARAALPARVPLLRALAARRLRGRGRA